MANFIKMKRDKNDYPTPPHTASVHPNEVEGYKTAGWTRVPVKPHQQSARQKKAAAKKAAAKKSAAVTATEQSND